MFCDLSVHTETQKVNDNSMNIMFVCFFPTFQLLHDSNLINHFIVKRFCNFSFVTFCPIFSWFKSEQM